MATHHRLRTLTAGLAVFGSAALSFVVAPPAHAAGTPDLVITEIAYGGLYATTGADGEYVEVTNIGTAPQDVSGWYWDTSTLATTGTPAPTAGTSLSTLGDGSGTSTVIAPGESFIITDLAPATFRTEWNLAPSVKVISDGAATMKKNGTVYVSNGTSIVDTLTYDLTSPAKGKSAWVAAANAAGQHNGTVGSQFSFASTSAGTSNGWTVSTAGDAEGSWSSAHAAIGAPAASRLGTGTPTNVQRAALAAGGGAAQTATAGKAFSFTGLTALGGTAPYTWSAPALSGTGLTIAPTTGAITGTPTATGVITVTATVTDSASATASQSFTITVASGIDPNWRNIVINEVTSDNEDNAQLTGHLPAPLLAALNTAPSAARDLVELYNTGAQAVDITNWKQTDSHGLASATDFSGRVYDATGTKITSIPAHGFGVFESGQGLGSGGDAVTVYLPDMTQVDSVAWGDGQAGYSATLDPAAAGPDTAEVYHAIARCSDGAGAINSNTSDTVTAWWSVKSASFDSSNAASCDNSSDPNAAVQKFNQQPPSGLPGTCTPSAPSGSDSIPVPDAVVWPTADGVHTVDNACEFVQPTDPTGNDMSGIVFSADGSVLWGAQNKNHLWKLVKDPATGTYLPATDNGWGNGKAITFTGTDPTLSQPDAEGITIGGNGNVFTTAERDNHNSSVSKNEVLEYDPSATGTTLTPVRQWDLTSEFVPSLLQATGGDSNLGFEGVTYVPDSFLTSHAFHDAHLNKAYDPADYPLHGTGLFFMAFEKNGHIYGYALNSDGSFQRVADIDTGINGSSAIADVQFNADDQGLWAHCDNDCGVTESLLRINAQGDFARTMTFQRPAGLPNGNLEGFAIAPASTATSGKREVVWSDDGIYGDGNSWNAGKTANVPSAGWGHALYAGTVPLDAAPTAISGSVTSSGQVGAAYSSPALSATGAFPNLITFSVSAGSLPDGLTLDSATGAITGTPTTVGQFAFTIAADNGVGSPATQSETVTIAGATQTLQPTPSIDGSGQVGTSLTANVGTWDSGVSTTYQWLDGATVLGSDVPLALTPALDGHTITLSVTGSKANYVDVTDTATVTVTDGSQTLQPTPSIDGSGQVGTSLTANVGTWDAGANTSYQWLDGATVLGSDAPLALTPALDGHTITLAVTSVETGYATVVSTANVAVIDGVQTLHPAPNAIGTRQVGNTLTADVGTWDSGASTTYQWLDGSTVLGSDAPLALTPSLYRHTISLSVTGTEVGYASVTRTTKVYVAAGVQTLRPTPIITGSGQVGTTLTANVGTWDTGATTSYKWVNGTTVLGRGAPLKLTPTMDGATITLVVTSVEPGYVTAVSSAAIVVVDGQLTTAVPTITGTVRVGGRLHVTAGTWGPGVVHFAFQWCADGVAIPGATGTFFTPAAAQLGQAISVTVTGSRAGYAPAASTSATTAAVTAGLIQSTAPVINGTLSVGQVLTVDPGMWKAGAAQPTLTYQWNVNGVAIAGATGTTLVVEQKYAGKRISVTVTGTAPGYTTKVRAASAASLISPSW